MSAYMLMKSYVMWCYESVKLQEASAWMIARTIAQPYHRLKCVERCYNHQIMTYH